MLNRSLAKGILGAIVATSATSGCKATGVFECEQDAQCRLDGVIGVCEPSGFCSFDDAECASGRRYDEFAGSLSGICVTDVDGGIVPTGCVAQVDIGDGAICAIDTADALWCWGRNEFNQLTTVNSPQLEPVKLTTPTGVTRVAMGNRHTCARVAGNTLVCFGANDFGQLGDNSTTPSATPVAPIVIGAVSAVAAGADHTCAIASADGGVFCWGRNTEGQVGDGSLIDKQEPVRVQLASGGDLLGVSEVAAGDRFTCARAGGTVFCWGENLSGQIGDGTLTSPRPTAVALSLVGVDSIDAGRRHACAGLNEAVMCWGDNDKGQVGDGTGNGIAMSPTMVVNFGERTAPLPGGGNVGLMLGREHSCGTIEGNLLCWGRNAEGQIADPAGAELTQAMEVTDLGAASFVAAGRDNTCAISGTLRCRGRNDFGQLATGSTDLTPHAAPLTIAIACD